MLAALGRWLFGCASIEGPLDGDDDPLASPLMMDSAEPGGHDEGFDGPEEEHR